MCGGWRVTTQHVGSLHNPFFHLTKNHPTNNTSQDGPMSPMPSERRFRITNDYVRALMGRSLGYELVLSEAKWNVRKKTLEWRFTFMVNLNAGQKVKTFTRKLKDYYLGNSANVTLLGWWFHVTNGESWPTQGLGETKGQGLKPPGLGKSTLKLRLWGCLFPLRIHVWYVYLPTWMVDFYGKCR